MYSDDFIKINVLGCDAVYFRSQVPRFEGAASVSRVRNLNTDPLVRNSF